MKDKFYIVTQGITRLAILEEFETYGKAEKAINKYIKQDIENIRYPRSYFVMSKNEIDNYQRNFAPQLEQYGAGLMDFEKHYF